MVHHLITAVAAAVPAILALWWSRRLARTTDDGVLFERLTANRTRNAFVTALCITLMFMDGGADWWWGLPLLVLMKMSAGYRLRKRLFNETWSLFGYASFFTRLCVAGFGFWILLGLSPWLLSLTGSRGWFAAGALAMVLFAFNAGYAVVFRRLLGTRRVDDPAIAARFDAMVRECALRNVTLEYVPMRGGAVVNAVALPSIRWPGVVMTSTLMERLELDEIAAVLGHELAHLEHYTPARLKTLNRMNYALIVSGTLLTPAATLLFPQGVTALMWVWQLVLLTALVVRAKDRQANETASDLRAIALGGDAEALARALVKIHAAGRVARRWDIEWERHATHPSLARRIQAIRAAAGMQPAKLGECATFTAADGSSVTFHDDRLVWSEPGAATHTLAYAALAMVRVDASAADARRLVAIDGRNRRWELAMHPDDVPRAQAVLDVVDGHLGAPAAPPAVSLVLPRMIALTAVVMALSVQAWATVLIAALAVALPALPVVGAAAAASLAAAAIVLRTHGNWIADWQPWMAFALLAAGALLLVVNVANRREAVPRRARVMMGTIGALAVLWWIPLALATESAVDLHLNLQQWPSITIFSFACGAGLLFMPRRAARYAAAPAIAAGLAAFVIGSTVFLDRFVDDPFVAQARPLQVKTIAGDPMREFNVGFTVGRMLLSPHGGFVAMADDEDESTTFHAGPAGGPWTTIDADDAFFVDEGRLLVLDHDRTGSVVRLVDLTQHALSVWSHRLDWSVERLSFDHSSNAWRAVGWSDAADDIVSAAGTVRADNVSEAHWETPQGNSYIQALGVSERSLLAIETSYAVPPAAPLAQLTAWLPRRRPSYRLWSLGRNAVPFGESHLQVTCPSPPVCAAYDGSRTGFFTVDPVSRRTTPLATIDGRSYLYSDAGYGWMAGWWEATPVLIRAATREAIRVAPRSGDRPYVLGIGETAVGAVTAREHGGTVRLYSLR